MTNLIFYNVIQHTNEFEEIMAAVKGDEKEKKLASTFIVKFAKSFPTLEEAAVDAMFDLCEDDNVTVCTDQHIELIKTVFFSSVVRILDCSCNELRCVIIKTNL